MKYGSRLVCCLFVLVLLCMSVCAHAETETLTSGDYAYRMLDDGTVEIVDYKGRAKELVVPDELGGRTVTSIGAGAFAECSSLTSITLPESVTSIGANPFSGCYALERIIVSPEHAALATIDGVLFSKADKRLICYPTVRKEASYTVPEGIRIIGDDAFYECSSLTSITLPDSVTSIGDRAFFWCFSLTSITLPESVTSIGDYAFYECSSLTSITLLESVTSIGDYAFLGCKSLTSITLPESVTSIGANPFLCCYALERIIVSPEHAALATIDGVLFSKADKRLIYYPTVRKEASYTVPEGIRIIGDSAFEDCGLLTSITLPESVTSIGDYAFWFCKSLTSITLPDSVTSIGDYAFKYCWSLTSITLPDSVTSIGDYAFDRCESLTSITLPESVTSIGKEAFSGCSNLTLTVPRDSYAAQYAREYKLNYIYPDSYDWLLD